jgi:cleavage and polyadenylation specificity factor subunit 1
MPEDVDPTTQKVLRRLKEAKDNTRLFIISLDLVAKSYQVISTTENLPYDVLYLTPCSSIIGGVIVVSATSIIHVDQASKVTALALSGWAVRVTELIFVGKEPPDDKRLEGSRAAFLDDTTLLLVTSTGVIHKIKLECEGRLVRQLVLFASLGASSPPSAVLIHKSMVFIASTADCSVLLKVPSSAIKSSSRMGAMTDSNMEIGVLCIRWVHAFTQTSP